MKEKTAKKFVIVFEDGTKAKLSEGDFELMLSIFECLQKAEKKFEKRKSAHTHFLREQITAICCDSFPCLEYIDLTLVYRENQKK